MGRGEETNRGTSQPGVRGRRSREEPGAYPPSQHEEDRRGVVRAFPTRFHPPGPAQEAGRPPRGAVLGSGRAGMLRLLAPLLSLALLPALARARGRQQAGRRAHTPPAGAATLRARRKLWLRPARSLRARARVCPGVPGCGGKGVGAQARPERKPRRAGLNLHPGGKHSVGDPGPARGAWGARGARCLLVFDLNRLGLGFLLPLVAMYIYRSSPLAGAASGCWGVECVCV